MNDLASAIEAFINGSEDNTFSELIILLFSYQFSNNLPYQRLCLAEGITPTTVRRWQEIPAVPTQAFKMFDLTCSPVDECVQVFHSSGTTMSKSSKHWMDMAASQIYDISLTRSFFNKVSDHGDIWAVMPSPNSAPHSSLSHMLGTIGAVCFAANDLTAFSDALRSRTATGVRLTLFGTAFGLFELLNLGRIPLPVGSIIIETGGFKGRTREIARDEFYAMLRHGFNVQDDACYSEYGMCELSSQFYSRGVNGELIGPRWIRTRCIDPLTNDDAEPGTEGLLRHYDLANYNSVAVIQTQDKATMSRVDGFRLLGRATDAELRGCSLTAEELWSL